MSHDDLPIDPPERDLAARLERDRPVPRPAFRGALRRRLEGRRAPRGLPVLGWRWVAASSSAGLVLLAVAVAGLAGAGPGAA